MTMLVASSFFYHFYVEGDGYGVADHFVAAGECVAHVDDAEILAIDFGGGGGAAARAVHYLDGLGGAGHVESYFFGDAVDGEGAGHLGGVVAVLHAGVEGGDVDACGDCGFGDVLVVKLYCAGYFCEFALDVGDAEMADGELGVGVGRVELPGGGLGSSRGGDA